MASAEQRIDLVTLKFLVLHSTNFTVFHYHIYPYLSEAETEKFTSRSKHGNEISVKSQKSKVVALNLNACLFSLVYYIFILLHQ